jgi:hypothetical protein
MNSIEVLVVAAIHTCDLVSFLFLLHFLLFAPSELLHIYDTSAAR